METNSISQSDASPPRPQLRFVSAAPPDRRIDVRDDSGTDEAASDELPPHSREPFRKVATPPCAAFRRNPRPTVRRTVMFGGIQTVSLPSRVEEERDEDLERETASRASSPVGLTSSHTRSSILRENGDHLRASMESSRSSTTALMSDTAQQSWFARIEPSRDMNRISNRFRDERLEESYQLYTSMVDLAGARRTFLFILVAQILAYLFFVLLQTRCLGPETPARINGTECFTYIMPEHVGYDFVLWAFAPFALLFGLFPLKFLEKTMRLRIVIYYFRRRWKSVALLILLLWSVGLLVYMHRLLFAVRKNRQNMINDGETSCGKTIEMERSWYEESCFFDQHPKRTYMSLQYWILMYQGKIAHTIIIVVMSLVIAVTGIVSYTIKLDFPHIVFNSCAMWVTTLLLRVFGITFSQNSRPAHNYGLLGILLLAALLPSAITIIATYAEERSTRVAYASKVRAERMNTTLKLDLSIKRMGLENRNLPREEKEMIEEELLNASDTRVLQQVSIPFAELDLKDVLAKTPSGDVLLADYHGTQVVLKRLALSSCNPEGLKDFKARVQMLAMIRHPNIVLFIGATYDNLANVGTIMEYLERGDVFSLLRSSIALTWSDPLLKIATDVALGVSYLHNCDPPLVHRDLKSSNLLCTTTYSCKISDFGEAKRQVVGGGLFSTIVGTPYWLAPEILREEKYDTQVDCFSFGIVLIELETRKDPYFDRTEESTIDIMMQVARGTLRPSIPSSCSPCRRDLILRCLDADPKKRPKMTEILHALQNEVRQEVFDQNSYDQGRDRRRMMLMQSHQRLNRRGVRDLIVQSQDDSDDE